MTKFDYRTNNFDRDALKRGVVHLGFGNFARALVADFLNRAAEKGCKDLGLVAVAPSGRQAHDFNLIAGQDNLYHLWLQNGGEICQRIGVLLETIVGAYQNTLVIERMANPDTQIVTLTVTGDGYFPNTPKKRETLESQNNDRAALRKKDWEILQTPAGWIVAALYKRYESGQEPFIVMSCDNILYNGKKTEALIQDLAVETGDRNFVDYVNTRGLFPNTVVDRITPKQNFDAQSAHLSKVARERVLIPDVDGHLATDRRPVVSELYREWVIEDDGRLPKHLVEALESAGVKFVNNIAHYQDRKLRVLNGGHMLFGIAGKILQIETVREAMNHRELRTLFDNMLEQTAQSLVQAQPNSEDILAYRDLVVERFENPHLTDGTERLVAGTNTKIHARFLNVNTIEQPGFRSDASAFAIATWVRYLQGRDDSGNPYSLDEGDVGVAEKLGLTNVNNPYLQDNLCRFLNKKSVAGSSDAWKAFTAQIVEDARLIQDEGLLAAIQKRYPSAPATLYTLPQPQRSGPTA